MKEELQKNLKEGTEDQEIQESDEGSEGLDPQLINEEEETSAEAEVQAEEAESEQEENTEEVKEKSKTQNKDRILDKVRRENYRYQAKIQELQNQLAMEMEEKERLRHLSEVSTNTAMGHYEAAATEKLNRARDIYQAAIDSGDPKSITEASGALAKATYEHEKVRSMKAEQEFAQQNKMIEQQRVQALQQQMQMNPMPQSPQLSEENYVAASGWVDNNDWFKQGSPNFDYNKFTIANQLIHNLDAYCYQNNMQNLIGSKDYFDTLDTELQKYEGQYQARQNHQGAQMTQNYQNTQQRAPVRSMVAPARGGYARTTTNGSSQSHRKIPLTQEEKDFARAMKMSEDQFRKRKIETMQNDPFRDQLRDQLNSR